MITDYSSLNNVKEIYFGGKTFINQKNDFKKGKGDGVRLNEDSEIVLEDSRLEGTYESPIVNTVDFKDLIGSWNAEVLEGSKMELSFQLRQNEEWSRWFTYGKWWSKGNEGSIKEQIDKIGNMDIDVLTTLEGKNVDGFKYKVDISRESMSIQSPKVNMISATLSTVEDIIQTFATNKNWEIELDVPKRSQMIVPVIGNIICSPTSLAMVLEYYGYNVETKDVAKGVFDNGAGIYGNWVYNVAYAGANGFTAYVDRCTSLEEIKDKIGDGIPVVASIRTKTVDELEGTPQAYPSGHLITVVGFKVKDGIEYIIVNDPAILDNDNVRREYLSHQFLNAWNGIIYCVLSKQVIM